MFVFTQLAAAVASQLEPAPVVFQKHSTEIIKAGAIEFEGWIFSSANHRYSGGSTNAETVAIEIAKSLADSRLVSLSLDITKGKPTYINEKLERDCRERVSLAIGQELRTEGLVTISEDAGAGVASAVRALPANLFKKKPLAWEQAVNLIEKNATSVEDHAFLFEVNLKKRSPEIARNRFNEAISSKFGVITKWQSGSVADGWYSLASPISEQRLKQLTIDDLLQLLARRPFDPSVTKRVAEHFKNADWPNAAEVVRSWPTILWKEDAEVDKQIAEVQNVLTDENATRRIGILKVVAHTGESWPVLKVKFHDDASLTAFREGRVAEALGGFIDALGKEPSADAANYVAACMLALNRPYCASCFSSLAMKWDGDHPYASGNLMLSMQALGNIELALTLAKNILDNPNSSQWAKGKASTITNSSNKQ